MAFSKKGKPHIIALPEADHPLGDLPYYDDLPDEVYDDLPDESEYQHEYVGDEDQLGSCDTCGSTYSMSDGINHCTTDGSCWMHCNDSVEHIIAQMKEQGVTEGAVLPPEWADAMQQAIKASFGVVGKPAPEVEAGAEVEVGPDTTLGQALSAQDEPGLIDYVMRQFGAIEVGRDATSSEIVGLYLTKVWLTGEGQHAEVVAYSEGTSLKVHRERMPECIVCASLAYYDKAFDILRVQAKAEVEAAEQQVRQQKFAQMKVCVECGKPPVGGRTYSLDEGEGFMCANCCGPHLIMDDGRPGNPWEDGSSA